MAILSTVGCLIGILYPQQPGTAGPASPAFESPRAHPVIHHAHALPPDTLLAVGLNPVRPHENELRRSGLGRLFDEQELPPRVGKVFEHFGRAIGESTDLGPRELDQLWRGGVTFAWTSLTEGQLVGWVALVNLGDLTEDVERAVERLQAELEASGGKTRTDMWNDIVLWSTRFEGLGIAYTIWDDMLIAGSTRNEVQAALERIDGSQPRSLLDNAGFREFTDEVDLRQSDQPLIAGFCDLQALNRTLLQLLPKSQRQKITPYLEHLHVTRIKGLGFCSTPRDGLMHDHFLVGVPQDRSGLMAAMLPQPRPIDSSLSSLAPDGITSFSLTHISINSLFESVMNLLGKIDEQYPMQVRGMLELLKQQTEMDLESDILPSLGERIVSMQWPGNGDDFAMVIELHNPQRLTIALNKFRALRRTDFSGFGLYMPSPRSGITEAPGVAIGNSSLVITSKQSRIKPLLEHIAKPKSNPKIKVLLDDLPEGAIGAGWSNLRESLSGNLSLIDRTEFAVQLAEVRRNLETLSKSLGEMRYSVTSSSNGVAFNAHSPTGVVGGVMFAFASTALLALTENMGLPDIAAMAEDDRSNELRLFLGVLNGVFEALQEQRERGAGEYGDLASLLEEGLVDVDLVGEPIGDGVFQIGNHAITVLLPLKAEDRYKHFVVVVWPAASANGEVYAITEDGRPLVNELLAMSEGMVRPSRRDIFVGGMFGGELTPGWRPIRARRAVATHDTPQASQGSVDRRTYERILELEENGKPSDAGELISLLGTEHPKLKARVAYVIGKLRIVEAVPELTEMVVSQTDPEVRQHAMAALKAMRDPRSLRASKSALESDDRVLRELAASNLGRLGDRSAIEPLLHFLASEVEEGGGRDRIQALVALSDIGDSSVLLPAASSIKAAAASEEEALAYLFQSLSPRLEAADEATTLVAVLDHESAVLRRYAIQRLGELGDPTTARALEGRLAQEETQLRPLLEVALSAVRGKRAGAASEDYVENAKRWFIDAKDRAMVWWKGLTPDERNIAAGGAGGGLLVLLMLMFLVRRRRRRAEANSWASMVAPSDDLEPGDYAEGEYEEEYETAGSGGSWRQ